MKASGLLRCRSPRRSIFAIVVLSSALWMGAVVYFLASEEKSDVASSEHSDGGNIRASYGNEPHGPAANMNRELNDEELRELHRQERMKVLAGNPQDDMVEMTNVNKLAMKMARIRQEFERRRVAQNGHLSDEEMEKAGREERKQERRLFLERLRQAEQEDLDERKQQHDQDSLQRLRNHERQLRHVDRGDDLHGDSDVTVGVQRDNEFSKDSSDEGDHQLEMGRSHEEADHKVAVINSDEELATNINNEEYDKNTRGVAVESHENQEGAQQVANNQVIPAGGADGGNGGNAVGGAMKVVSDEEKKQEKSAGYNRHAFNQQESDRIGDYRDIPDSRHRLCEDMKYPSDLPKASIIICFHNEALSALRRTIKTAIVRGGVDHILEVLLVDDASTMDELQDGLADSVKDISPKVRVLHLTQRHGLIRGRIRGAQEAKGKVIVFLDSHCEANRNWLLPLVDRIHQDRTHVVCPVIDIINLDTLEYQFSPLVRGGFTWALNFNWENIPYNGGSEREMIQPARSPTMAGGLFAIDRSYFFEVGSYDQGMDIWGGENLEISFRLWMCGGTLEIMPCSRVGHIFRQRRPYDDTESIAAMSKNSVRVAEVWLDEYKELYYQQRTFGSDNPGDIMERVELRKKLKCKSFQWYLENVTPDKLTGLPDAFKAKIEEKLSKELRQSLPKDLILYGQLKNPRTSMCISTTSAENGGALILAVCAASTEPKHLAMQTFALTNDGHIQYGKGNCLQADVSLEKSYFRLCKLNDESQQWQYFEDQQLLYSRGVKKCLRVNMDQESIELQDCDKANTDQRWTSLASSQSVGVMHRRSDI